MAAEGTDSALLHRHLVERPLNVQSAAGTYLNLQNGSQIIDFCGGAAVTAISHTSQEVIDQIVEQLQKVSYVHTGLYTTDAAEELANIILENNPYGLEKAFFVGSGSESVDTALKLARQYHFEKGETQRNRFVSRYQSYHGNTIGSMSVSSNLARKIPYQGAITLPNVSFVSPAYPYQYQKPTETEEQYVERLIGELDAEFVRVGPETVIAFIAETVGGATAGCIAAPKGYFPGVRALCDKYGILLILDEVMCGIGRTGTYFAFEQEDIIPDIVTIGKGLGGGYAPISGALIHERIISILRQGTKSFNHGHTFQAHPVSCAAALAVQKIIRRENLVQRCSILGQRLGSLLRDRIQECKYVGDIRGRGFFWAVEFVSDKQTKASLPREFQFGYKLQQKAFELGLAVYPGAGTVDGVSGDHVLLSPALNVEEELVESVVDILKTAYLSTEAEFDSLKPDL